MGNWEQYVRRVNPYIPGEQPAEQDVIKLNTNECPYPPSPKVAEVIASFDADLLRKYPDPDVRALRKALAAYHDLTPERVFVGVGSDDVIATAYMTFFGSKKPILFPDVSYTFYDVWADVFGVPYETCDLTADLHIDPEDYRRENGGIILPNPNAPTGIAEGTAALEKIISENPDSVVIIDEAYVDFGAESVIPLLEEYDNLLVVRTFSKSRALAGSRIGYALGSARMISFMWDVRNSLNSYTMDAITQAVGLASLQDDAYFKETLAKIIDTREKTMVALRELGFTGTDSKTNFLFVTHPAMPAAEIYKKLREKNIFVRHFRRSRTDNYLRITVGLPEQMEALIEALKEILA